MSEFEFWKDIGNISEAILNYQKKNAEFNNRFINPWIRLGTLRGIEDGNEEIVQAYKHATEIDPHTTQNWIDLGNERLKAGIYEDAMIAYKEAVKLGPKDGWLLSNLALTLVLQGKYEEAIPLYEESIELFAEEKEKAISWNRLGDAYRKLNDYENAFLSFQKADELEGKKTRPSNQSNDISMDSSEVDAENNQGELLSKKPQEKINDLVDPLTNLVKLPALAIQPEAETSMDAAVINNDQNEIQEETIYVVTSPEIRIEKVEEEQLLAEAITQRNNTIPSWLSEAHKNNLVNHIDETKDRHIPDWLIGNTKENKSIDPVLAIEQAETEIQEPISQLIIKSAASNESTEPLDGQQEADAEKQEDIKEEDFIHLEENAVTHNLIPDVSKKQSEELAYEEYLKDVVEPMTILSDHLDEICSQTKISNNSEPLTAMETKNAQVWNELGNVYLKSGSFDEAIAAYSKAIELERHFGWPYSNLALAYVEKDYLIEAVMLYQRSIELFTTDKDKAITWNRLGNVYRLMNDYDNAIAAYQTADELDPENSTLSLRSSFGLLGKLSAEQKSIAFHE
jgi:tetratricopeptide (TPR) repeat protein